MNLGNIQLVTAVWTSTKWYIQACAWILQKQHSRTGSINTVRRGYDAAADASIGALVTRKQRSGAYFIIWWTSEEPIERVSLEKSNISPHMIHMWCKRPTTTSWFSDNPEVPSICSSRWSKIVYFSLFESELVQWWDQRLWVNDD